MNGPVPITPDDIRQWCEMTGSILTREDRAILISVDASYRSAWAEEAKDQAARKQSEPGPS